MASYLVYLHTCDFQPQQGEKGMMMCLHGNVAGFTAVLYYTNDCQYCEEFLHVFRKLSAEIHGCQFCMVNMTKNSDLVEKTKGTIAPITFVPDLIFYVNGIPYMRYEGDGKETNIRQFILDMSERFPKTTFLPPSSNEMVASPSRPAPFVSPSSTTTTTSYPPVSYPTTLSPPPHAPAPPRPPPSSFSSTPAIPVAPSSSAHTMYPPPAPVIPEYTIGKPKCGKNERCYLDFSSAYVTTAGP